MARVTMFLYRTFELDSRVERQARTLSGLGHEVEVIAVLGEGLAEREERDGYRIRRVSANSWLSLAAERLSESSLPALVRNLARRGRWFLYWRSYLRRARRAALAEPSDLYFAHDLDAFEAGVRAKRRTGAPLIYDAHELFSDVAWMADHPAFERRAWNAYESVLLRRADRVFAVTESRATEMAGRYSVPPPRVLRNVPEVAAVSAPVADVRSRLAIPDGTRIVLYLGAIQPHRGLEQAIAAVSLLSDCALVLMGEGEPGYVEHLRRVAGDRCEDDALLIASPVRPHEVVVASASADVGLILNPAVSLNNYLSLPNKIFEYLAAGVPVVASDFPDMASLIAEYEVGATCDPEDPADIARAIGSLLEDPDRHAQLATNAERAAEHLNWELESEVLVGVVTELLQRSASGPCCGCP